MPILAEFAMQFTIRYRLFALVATFAVILGIAGTANSAWVIIKNDTAKTITIQEIVVVNGQTKRGKPTTLLPGDTIREYVPGPTTKKIEVFDSQSQSLWSGKLNCKDETQTFSVSIAGGKVTVGPIVKPVPKK